MSSIDNRIVNMQFNNKGFESGVNTTLNSLKKLNESLKMKDATNGLVDISSSLNKVNNSGLASLSKGVEAVTSRFSALAVIATTALMNITNKAVDAGTAFAKSITVEPIMSGFSEYETKMGSIQTILTNTAHEGKTLTDVTAVLDELNKYADQTIYNFAEMTKNIGTFTAAGVGLDTSAAAIKGIANLAAASGSTSQQASTAMYQLSQALAAGKVSLMDWNSVVNAGMGGKLFQDALIRTSEVLGTNAEEMIKKYGSFRESLTKGEWLTSEVLTETLKQLSGAYTEADLVAQGFTQSQAKEIVKLAETATAAATEVKTVTQLLDTMKESVQSGWAQSWEYIIGDKNEATKTLTAINDAFNSIIEPSTKARNEMLKTWNELGGREDVIAGLTNIFGSLGKILGSVKEAFREVFPPMTGEKLVQLSEGFKNFTEKIKISDETAKKIKDTFQGVFSVFGLVGDAFKSILGLFGSGVSVFGSIANAALSGTASMGRFFTSIYDGAKASGIFDNISNSVKNGLISIQNYVKSCGDAIGNFMSSLGKVDLGPIFNMVKEITTGLGKGLASVLEGLGASLRKINLNNLLIALTALAGKDIFKTIKESILGFGKSLESFGNIGNSIVSTLDSVKDTLKAYQSDLNATTLTKIAAAIGILAASILVLSTISSSDMETALVGLSTIIIEIVAALAVLLRVVGGAGFMKLNSLATSLVGISTALLVLAGAVKAMSNLSWNELTVGLTGVAGAMVVLAAGSHLLNTNSKGMISTGVAMIALASALIVMAEAVSKFGELNCSELITGLVGVGAVLAELGLFMKLTEANRMGLSNSAGILAMAAAIVVLQNAVAEFGKMDIQSLIIGLSSLGALLLELAAFTKLASGSTGMLTTSAAMVVMAGAINLMVPAVKSLGSLSWEEIAKGLTSLAGALVVLGVASATMSGIQLAAVGAGLAVMAASMLLLGTALKSMGSMSWEEIAKSLVTMAGSLVIFAAAMAGMTAGLPGAAAMLTMAAAMTLFTPQLIAMAKLSWGEIAAGLAMLAGAFTVIGVAGLVLGPLTPIIAGLSAAIALLGVACLAAGMGVAAFGAGMATLAAVGAAGGYALVEIIKQLCTVLPQLGAALGKTLIEFAKAIGEGMPALAKAMGQCMVGICQAISDAIPQIIATGIELLTALCEVLLSGAPRLIEVAVEMIIALAEGLVANASKLAECAVELVISLINGLASKVGELIQAGIDLGIAIIEGLADGITNNQERVKDALKKLGKAIIDAFKSVLGINSPSRVFQEAGVDCILGLINGITSKAGEVVNKIKTLASDMINAVKSKASEFLSAGGNLISNLASGVSSKVGTVVSSVKTMMSNGVSAVTSNVSQFLTAGKNVINNLARGVSSGASGVSSALRSAMNSAKSAVSGVSGQFTSIGRNVINGLRNGISSMASSVASAARNVVQRAVNSAKSALGIHSPSRVFMEIGDYSIQGLVKGLEDNAYTVDSPATNIAERVVSGVSGTISAISKSLQDDLNVDTDVTIKPVIDLSNVESGTKTIRDMMAENNKFTINADATGAISRSIGVVQNGLGNEELLSAIKDLKSNIGNSNTTYQINGITYDDGSNVQAAIETLIRATTIERRI